MSASQLDMNAMNRWLIHGERGISSEAMAAVFMGLNPDPKWGRFGNHPHDPSDFNRCVGLLRMVPGTRERLSEIAAISPIWAALVEHWDELEALLVQEFPSGRAPLLYDRMKELGC